MAQTSQRTVRSGLVSAVSFDRAADYYDATRALPDDVREAIAELLVAELSDRGRCLEIGVGSGRMSLPLHARRVELMGADISLAMLERLVRNAGGRPPFPLVVADATRLPLHPSSFGAVLASHLLHLVRDWTRALEEALRVLTPEGVLLIDFGGATPMPWSAASNERLRRHGVYRIRPGVSDPNKVVQYLGNRMSVRRLPPVSVTVRRSLRRDLDEWERQIYSWTWTYTMEQMRAACADIRDWASGEGWPLDETFERERTIQWWVFEWSTAVGLSQSQDLKPDADRRGRTARP
jgi:ubiquinone/menaquinone biosynthesis C-methylase UbiE